MKNIEHGNNRTPYHDNSTEQTNHTQETNTEHRDNDENTEQKERLLS